MRQLKLLDFQEELIDKTANALSAKMSIVAQSTTGSGKTVIFSEICNRFIKKTGKDVIIFVHKKELLRKTRETILLWHSIVSQEIDADTKYIIPGARVFVAMVETFNNRGKHNSFLDQFTNVGLCIIDECHIGNFNKILMHFIHCKRIGFTATPVSAKKKDPLKNHYQGIVCGPPTSKLIELNRQDPSMGVVPCVTYSMKNIDRSTLAEKGDDFDDDKMGEEFSKKQQIENTINAYLTRSYGKKTLVFNANIKHSLKVNDAFLKAGLNSRHLDSSINCGKEYRDECFRWLNKVPNAILNNVGIATTGLDEPSIETVIPNKSTKSLPLWNQICGRGARPYMYPDGTWKDHFLVLDMGDNVVGGNFGQWSDDQDWEFMFNNPKLPRPGIAPVKTCPECGAINTAAARTCTALEIDWLTEEEYVCGFVFPIAQQEEDTVEKTLQLIGTIPINVKANIEFFADRHEYYSMHETYKQVANYFRTVYVQNYLDSETLKIIIEAAYIKVCEWFKTAGKRKWPGLKEKIAVNLIPVLEGLGFIIPGEEISEMNGFNGEVIELGTSEQT